MSNLLCELPRSFKSKVKLILASGFPMYDFLFVTGQHAHEVEARNHARQVSFVQKNKRIYLGHPVSRRVPLRFADFFVVVVFFSSAALSVATCCEQNNGLGRNFAQPYLRTCFRSR